MKWTQAILTWMTPSRQNSWVSHWYLARTLEHAHLTLVCKASTLQTLAGLLACWFPHQLTPQRTKAVSSTGTASRSKQAHW